MTALLCPRSAASVSDGSTETSGKEKAKQQISSDIIGLHPSCQLLTFLASVTSQAEQKLQIKRSILRACGRMELHTDLIDAHIYAFKRAALEEVLEQRPGIHSIKEELVPYLIRSQLTFETSFIGKIDNELKSLEKNISNQLLQLLPHTAASSSQFNCYAYVASKDRYCARINSIQAYNDVNHDVAGDKAIHIIGYEVSKHNNVIHPTAKLGHKSTIMNSVVMNYVTLEDGCQVQGSVICSNAHLQERVNLKDGCQVQGSVICSNAHLQERVNLKDCQVGAGYTIATGEYQAEALSKK